jgi:hypothetical protein
VLVIVAAFLFAFIVFIHMHFASDSLLLLSAHFFSCLVSQSRSWSWMSLTATRPSVGGCVVLACFVSFSCQ